MTCNISKTDRIIRLLALAVAAILFFTGTVTGTLGIVILAAGIILGITSLINFCPLYAIFGFSTFKNKKTESA